ncbi:hypothetical protein BSZ39_00410 [Bowdeniella nasicola]|uniref:Major facilitator superfamily (MFS) profile domain-containing protein n=2 Tax=Bowdeniella nasicola TaxID=208480 RepID=A0A1Q5Q5X1_9ACTO|nr:hypothetical protein BSZ39_00410 [Bowdeniella nasicola]
MRVWLAAVAIYIIAIAGRTSFGVVGVAAAPTYPIAIGARVLVGLGDATAFVSVIRLIPAWFPTRRIPLMTQLTAILGQLGPIVSAVPFLAILGRFGWVAAFASLAATGILTALLGYLAIVDTPDEHQQSVHHDRVGAILSSVTRHPGTWLGFFTHFALLFSPNVFLILWGMPLLTVGQGYSAATAAALISVNSIAGIAAGPAVAAMLVRHPWQRALVVLGIIVALIIAWSAVLAVDGQRPVWLWTLLVIVLAIGGAGSSIGFDFARTSLPPHHYGTASGLVNMGGFISSITAIMLVGVILDALAPDKNFSATDFRIALLVMVPIMAIGVTGILISRHKLRARLATEGILPLSVPQIVRRVMRSWREGS